MSSTTGKNSSTLAADLAADAFNRHGSFTARSVENGLAVELRAVDTGAHLTTVWVPGDGLGWTWPPTPNSERLRSLPKGATLDELVRAVAVSVLDEAATR